MALVFKKIGPTVLANGVERVLLYASLVGCMLVGRISKPAEDQLIKYNSLVLPKENMGKSQRYRKERPVGRISKPAEDQLIKYNSLVLPKENMGKSQRYRKERPVEV
ncbi:hypothetical protein CDAR_618171 [Caerostris darwini]|uniref:Uncharacterized protein n=1 Tax=Caerostris darwini TaxID=1538125 RepID=A0AAV4U923_9ARAC|nr:hypothetical protein CDAR_618171 [Caerostris darwini]